MLKLFLHFKLAIQIAKFNALNKKLNTFHLITKPNPPKTGEDMMEIQLLISLTRLRIERISRHLGEINGRQ